MTFWIVNGAVRENETVVLFGSSALALFCIWRRYQFSCVIISLITGGCLAPGISQNTRAHLSRRAIIRNIYIILFFAFNRIIQSSLRRKTHQKNIDRENRKKKYIKDLASERKWQTESEGGSETRTQKKKEQQRHHDGRLWCAFFHCMWISHGTKLEKNWYENELLLLESLRQQHIVQIVHTYDKPFCWF